ncbi:hypothetical protein [Nakamurella leprariae]|uniref:Uncharacterized protein n=1 Tax=Nakamurella leprariae TaxID=2803911 RepID=A0A938YHS6_9ACTN|nr:hypothetical protein [Nakamurella leprariae]MBM9468389.1 hypothetical protein [Nakamurella leprariae]
MWVWLAGGVILLLGAGLPLLRARPRVDTAGRARARMLVDRLEHALDDPGLSAADRQAGERYRLLAGGALAGAPSGAAVRRAERWAVTGLRAVGAPTE